MIPEYLDIKQVGAYIGKPWNSLRRTKGEGKLPPHDASTKPHKWKRSDIDAQQELRRLGLWNDNAWLSLRGRLGVEAAWALMLKRLEEVQARTATVVAREIAEQKA